MTHEFDTYYIQYTTDFHVIAALGAIENFDKKKIILLGPKSNFVKHVASLSYIQHQECDPTVRGGDFRKLSLHLDRKNDSRNYIITPFVYPFFVINLLKNRDERIKLIIRTDEGVGTYASIRHYYLAYLNEGQSKFRAVKNAFLKRNAMRITQWLRVCTTNYLFDRDGQINEVAIKRIKNILGELRSYKKLINKTVFVTQPGINKNFSSEIEYAGYLKSIQKDKKKSLIIKKHPSDIVDYTSHGFKVIDELPLEAYDLKGSTIIGFSSTALLMAKLLNPDIDIYYITNAGNFLNINSLSYFNQKLFRKYLKPY